MVGIYCRISGDKEDGKDTSIESQEERGIAFAHEMEMPYEIYKDINVSGKAPIEKRYDFGRFIKDIQSKKLTHVFAINQARIERSPKTWDIFVASVLSSGCKWYPEGKFFDLESTTNRLLADLLSSINKFHSDNTSDAVKIAFEKNARLGKVHGISPYGIMKNDEGYMMHEPNEIEVVKDIFKWSLEGIGVYKIANKLNEQNVPTRYTKLNKSTTTKDASTGKIIKHENKVWWGSTVHGILKKKLYAGIHVWNKEEIKLPHLAVITNEEFDKVQKNLKKNKRTKSGKKPIYKYLLNGLIYCNDCGKMYKGKRRLSDRRNQYICSGKNTPGNVCIPSKGFNIPRFETFIIKHLFLSKELQKHLNKIEVDTLEIDTLSFKKNELIKKIKVAEKRESRAYNLLFGDDDDLADDQRLKDTYKQAKEKVLNLKESLEQVESQLKTQTDNNRLNRVNKAIEGFDLNAGFEAIKQAVQQLIERIDVDYKPLDKNGLFWFRITYKGFNESISFRTNQQLLNYVCTKHIMEHPEDELGLIMVEERIFNKQLFKYKLEGIIKDDLDVQVSKDELIVFN